MSIEQYNSKLDEAMEHINKGGFTTLEELEKEMESLVSKKFSIVIDEEAKKCLKQAYRYIKKDTSQNAEKVRAKILAKI